MKGTLCVTDCGAGYYKNDGPPKICSTCDSSCTLCDGGLASNC